MNTDTATPARISRSDAIELIRPLCEAIGVDPARVRQLHVDVREVRIELGGPRPREWVSAPICTN